MSLVLDHIVIAVRDLDDAAADYAALGFTVVRGGAHANGITHNVLVIFEDGAYLELIAWKRPDPGNRWWDVYERAGEGLIDFALLPDEIEAVVAGAQARGLDIQNPIPGGRNRPDGARLEWRTARSPRPDVPFLCGDVTPRSLRVQEGAVRRHGNGVVGVATLTVVVADLEASVRRNAALLGFSPPTIQAEDVAGAPARSATLTLANGTAVTWASPAASEGPLAASLAARGEGPFSASLRAAHPVGALDTSRSHGAPLSITL
ncbi:MULTISPECIES: VOC family protein [unclassified Methylobacterium]|uniref:VOC family protein n=1 Tax=unclassified Methylobacterium TaxID=2615210 RepID=UPI001FBA6FD0|nr:MULTISPECIES: VOC family protein [unclassified Methylobacterium]MCJ2093641.1 VOC family protein [Methylobacterium sp. J-072]MCJ2122352.1 VOC family protein [Methylobacterium sp. J-077]